LTDKNGKMKYFLPGTVDKNRYGFSTNVIPHRIIAFGNMYKTCNTENIPS